MTKIFRQFNHEEAKRFAERAAQNGFSISVSEAQKVLPAAARTMENYAAVQKSDYLSHPPAGVFRPVRRSKQSGPADRPAPGEQGQRADVSVISPPQGGGSDAAHFVSITEAARLIREGSESPVTLTRDLLDRIEGLDGDYLSFLEIFREKALADAEKAADELSEGKDRGPLHGIPIALKDIVDVEGSATTCGSPAFLNSIASTDAVITRRLKESGAILIGKTNLAEFALGMTGVNPHTGTPHNPWNRSRATAGSSSGSAVAVAAGFAYAAIGSDTGGSIRMPAALCGVAGLKPTYGVVPLDGVFPLSWSLDHVGPMARSSADCAVMMNVLAGCGSENSTTSSLDFVAPLKEGLNGLRLGVPRHYFFDGVHPEIEKATLAAVDMMCREGAEVVELDMPWAGLGRDINLAVMIAEAVSVHARLLVEFPEGYSDPVRTRIQSGLNVSAAEYISAQRARQGFCLKMSEAMAGVDALITPTCPVPAPTIVECTPEPSQNALRLPAFTGVFDTTGQPSLSVNCGFMQDGMPIGLMITAHPFEDAVALRIGHALESVLSGTRHPNVG